MYDQVPFNQKQTDFLIQIRVHLLNLIFKKYCKLNNASQKQRCKILTQFQGRSRIPEGTSQCLGGCSRLAKHKNKLQRGHLDE